MIRIDPFRVHVEPHFYFLIFYKNLPSGRGVTISVYIHDIEYLKYDCQGENDGHYHIYNQNGETKIFFDETTRESQIEKSIQDISQNLGDYLKRSDYPVLQEFEFDPHSYIDVLSSVVKSKMLEYVVKYT